MSDPRDLERGAEDAGAPAVGSETRPPDAPDARREQALADDLVVVGRVRKSHGVRGELVVEATTTAPEVAFAVGRRLIAGTPDGRVLGRGGRRELTVRRVSPFKGGWILALSSIDDRNEADLWRDRTLLAHSSDLPAPADDEVYYHDLIGLRVELADGTPIGEITDLFELPQGLAFDVRRDAPANGTVIFLYRPEIVAEVDLGRRVVVVTPPDGLLE